MLLVMVILNPNRAARIRNDHALWVKKNTNAVKQIIPKLMDMNTIAATVLFLDMACLPRSERSPIREKSIEF